ncbi:hypothetical protein AAFC00_000908 [Neodothiora populina]|uniref:Phthalate transporter n=1 Tax=Neodothiora populina TaxID=2781224 RepID=A0ABR3PM84_9PEZI
MSTVLAGKVKLVDSNSSSSTEVQHGDVKELKASIVSTGSSEFPLGEPKSEKRFWYQRNKEYDADAIATQPSVFDDPETAKEYQPRDDWENIHRFDPSARWTWREENKVIRKIDLKIMVFTCIMFMALELDRANISQANTDNFLKDLHLTTNDFNLGNTVFKLGFLCAELPSQLVSKWVGPDRWIPTQMVLWSVVATCQFRLDGRSSFLACRVLLGFLQGGFIPDVILYLSYFYKHHELSLRLGFFWTAMFVADILSAFMGFGILHMRGVGGHSGWRWLFLIEGLLTLVIGLLAFVLMPAAPTNTASWFRGKKGWFTEREETIMINRVIREDPTKGMMHNRQPITPKLLWQSLKDYDLWPIYLIGLTFSIPVTPQSQYLTLSLKGLGFGTFQTNLLVIPSTCLHMVNLLISTYASEVLNQLSLVGISSQLWPLPMLIWFVAVDTTHVNKWVIWAVTSLIIGSPYTHALQVSWCSRNSNSIRTRTVSAAAYNMLVQTGGIISSNIYQKSDAPRYPKGNRALLGVACFNIVLYLATKVYYVRRNKKRDEVWNKMTREERVEYLANTTDEGNKRLDFRFAH